MKSFETLDSPVHSHFRLQEHTKPNALDLDPSLGLGQGLMFIIPVWHGTPRELGMFRFI